MIKKGLATLATIFMLAGGATADWEKATWDKVDGTVVLEDLTVNNDITVLGNLYQNHKAASPHVVVSDFETDGDTNYTEWVATAHKDDDIYVDDMDDNYAGGADSELEDSWVKSGASNTNEETGAKCYEGTGSCQKVTTVVADYTSVGVKTDLGAAGNIALNMPIKASIYINCDDCDATDSVKAYVNAGGRLFYMTPELPAHSTSAEGTIVPTSMTEYSTTFIAQFAANPLRIEVLSGSGNTGAVNFYVDQPSIQFAATLSEPVHRDLNSDGISDTLSLGRLSVVDSSAPHIYMPREGDFMYGIANDGDVDMSTIKTFTTPQDYSKHHFDFWVYINDVSAIGNGSLGITLIMGDGTTLATATVPYVEENNQWNHVTLSRAAFSNDTTIDWGAITTVKFAFNTIAADQYTVFLDGFKAFETFPFPMITFGFDDTDGSAYLLAKPYLETYGYKGAAFLKTLQISQSSYLWMSMIREMDTSGWDVSSHSHTHPNFANTNRSRANYELVVSQRQLEELGVTKGKRFFAYPSGIVTMVSGTNEDLVRRYYKMAFTSFSSSSYINPLPYGDPYRFQREDFGDVDTGCSSLAADKLKIDDLILYNGWLVTYYHGLFLSEDADDATQDVYDCFTQLVDYANDQGVLVVTPSQVFDNLLLGETYKDRTYNATQNLTMCDTTNATTCVPLDADELLTVNGLAVEAGGSTVTQPLKVDTILVDLETAADAVDANIDITLPDCTDNVGLTYKFMVTDTDTTTDCTNGAAQCLLVPTVAAGDSISPALTDASPEIAGESFTIQCDGNTTWFLLYDGTS